MKALVCNEPGKLAYTTKALPVLKEDTAIIKIQRIGICGTDLHAFRGTQPYFNYPRILGHELAGELVDVDGAAGFHIGEPVTFIPYFSCGTCIACRTGKPNCCIQIRVCGVHIDGGMVEYLAVPSSSLLKGQGLDFDELALVEPLAIGAHGVRRAGVMPDEFVLVIGAGPIGLGTMQLAQMAGAKVIALDTNASRLQFCQDRLQIPYTINATDGKVIEQIQEITSGDMPEVVIDATGSLAAINQGFQYMSHGGRYVLIGLQKGDISFSHPEFHKRESTLMSSRNATKQDFEYVMDCMRKGKIKPTTYITHRAQFDEVKNEFEGWLDPANGVIKAMIQMI